MITVLIATASALIGQPAAGPTQDRCTVVRYAADGRRTESLGDPAEFGIDIRTSRDRGSSSVSVRSRGSSSSSVSASSSHGSARSTSSTSHRDGDRTITTHTDNSGCTIIVDERPAARRDR